MSKWTKFATKFYKNKKRTNKNYKFSDALKEAAEVYNGGDDKKANQNGGDEVVPEVVDGEVKPVEEVKPEAVEGEVPPSIGSEEVKNMNAKEVKPVDEEVKPVEGGKKAKKSAKKGKKSAKKGGKKGKKSAKKGKR